MPVRRAAYDNSVEAPIIVPADSAPLSLPPGPIAANDGGSLLAGRYRLETLLGKGGMGEVWAVTDTKLNREVAVKLTQLRFADHPDFARAFVDETQLAARLSHPNIPHIHTTETAPDGRLFMVMELVKGITLRRLIEDEGKVPPVRMICYALFAVEALGYAHEAGVRHRDVKPENLMVREDGAKAWLLDFGIAKRLVVDENAMAGATTEERAVRGGKRSTVLGTVGYVPPEVALGGVADHRGDLFQLGVTIYEAISGRKPFPVSEDNKTAMLRALLFEDPPSLPEHECPAGLWIILLRLLAKAPEDRYGSAGELLADLVTLLSQFRESVPAGPLREQLLQKERQDRVVRTAFASVAPLPERPPSARVVALAQGGTEPMAGRPTLPLGSAFVKRGPTFREAKKGDGGDKTGPMPPGLVVVSPAHPAAASSERPQKEEQAAVVTAALDVAGTRSRRAWVEGPGLAEMQAEPPRLARSREGAAASRIEAVPARLSAASRGSVVPARLSAAFRGPSAKPVLGLAALSIAVLGMGIGMMVQAQCGQRRAEERPAGTVSVGPMTASSMEPVMTASATPAVATAAPALMASAAPTGPASAAPASKAARQAPPARKSPELIDPFSDKARTAAKSKPGF